ncbi:Post-transcriptional regulator [Pilibacter termitis]|uniref:Post-transcriptional regulator n=1 Tax=Pilibacter termitis TaxID=263852 RepID=A0A1T4R5L5_9ENTE|nr:post-transcriptional regulator [Pilibacter termitis]SKA11126.1 Post-transcriptional regulator [Pilibacter termitis]
MQEVQLNLIDRMRYKAELSNKVEKFRKMGYIGITERDLLNYLVNYRWSKQSRWTLNKRKKDILEVQAHEFFDYQRILAATSKENLENCQELRDLI